MKIRTEQVIDVSEWDKLVEETYGRPYSFQQQDGCQPRGNYRLTVPDKEMDFDRDMNDSVPEVVNGPKMGVKFAAWLARDPKQPPNGEKGIREDAFGIELWWYRNFYPCIQTVANDLHAKGLLPAGKYTINIDW